VRTDAGAGGGGGGTGHPMHSFQIESTLAGSRSVVQWSHKFLILPRDKETVESDGTGSKERDKWRI
jgi:hypothetical protein